MNHAHRVWLLAVVLAVMSTGPVAAKKDEAPAWPEITPAERELKSIPQDPEAAGVILINVRDGKVITSGKYLVNLLDYHWRLKVLNDRGKDYGEVQIPAGKHSKVSKIEARTVKADGTVVPVPADQIFEKVVAKGRGFKETAWVFNFPAVEPGAILEYRYERETGSLIFVEPWQFSGPEFTKLSRVTQALPSDAHYISLCDKCPNPEPDMTEWHEGKMRGRRFTVEMHDVPADHDEYLMPPDRAAKPRFEMVLKGWTYMHWDELGRDDQLFTDWPSVARYVDYRYRKAYLLDETAMAALVGGWLKGVADPEQRVAIIARHVQADYRYVEYSSILAQTRSLADIVKDHSADNEEKAVLLVGTLRAIGIEPSIALVAGNQKGPVYSNFYSLTQFSHAIVGVPKKEGGMQWIDPTATYAPFGFLPWYDSGAMALLIKERGVQLITLPKVSEPGSTRYAVTVTPQANGKADLEVTADYEGEDAMDMRDDLAPAAEAERRTQLEKWADEARSGAVLQSYEIHDLDDVDKPLRITMRLSAPGLVTHSEGVMSVKGCVLECFGTNPISRSQRRYPIYVDRGMHVEQIVTILAPEGMKPGSAPGAQNARSPIGSMSFICAGKVEGGIQCTRKLMLTRDHWPVTEGDELRAMFEKFVGIDTTSVAFEDKPSGTE